MQRHARAAFLWVCAALLPQSAQAQLRGKALDLAIDEYLEPLLALRTFSGVILVARGDSILAERGYGLADAELNVPITTESVFRIASISKSFTRALIGRLADHRALALTDPLSRWLPAFPSADRITIEMLLDHRAGVPDRNSLPYDEEASTPQTLTTLVDSLARSALDFAPGTARRYSNGGYAILARIIELTAGQPYEVVLSREILQPLGLSRTRHQQDGELVPGLAHGAMPSASVPDQMVAPPYQAMATKTGGGSLVSTTRDLLAWARAIGKHPVLTPPTWQRLFANDSSFAFDGRCPGYMSFLLHQGDMTAVVLANNYDAMVADVGRALIAMAAGRKPDALPVVRPTPQDSATAGVEGVYQVPDGAPLPARSTVEVRQQQGHLIAYVAGVPMDVLIPQGGRSYLLRNLWSVATFSSPDNQEVSFVDVTTLYDRSTFRAARARPTAPPDTLPTDVALSIYAVALRYYSPPPRQVRWIEKPRLMSDEHYGALLEQLGSRYRSWEPGDPIRESGGTLRVTDIKTLGVDRWRVSVWFRYQRPSFRGPESELSFDIDRRGTRFVIVSRDGGSAR